MKQLFATFLMGFLAISMTAQAPLPLMQNHGIMNEDISSTYLDSTIRYYYSSETDSALQSKRVYSYEANGKETLNAFYNWDNSVNDWVGYRKYEYSYDVNGKFSQDNKYIWDNSENDWVADEKSEYDYGANGNDTLVISYDWDSSISDWIGNWKSEYSYDANGNDTLLIVYSWNTTINDWVLDRKYEYSPDANGNDTLVIYYDWDMDIEEWVADRKYEYSHDANGNDTLEIYYDWDIGIKDWLALSKSEYSCDANGNDTLLIRYDWDMGINDWLDRYKSEYSYNLNGYRTSHEDYSWDASNNDWVGQNKTEYSYDVNDNRTLEVFYNWTGFDIDWLLVTKIFYYYSVHEQLDETDILSYSFNIPPQTGDTFIDDESHTVDIAVNKDTDLTALLATFALSDGASAKIGDIIQESGITANDFSNPVTYTITPADGETVQDWIVTVNLAIGIGEHILQELKIYPNPFSDRTTIIFSNPSHSEYKLAVYNTSGNKVYEMDNITTGKVEFGKGALTPGIYIVELHGIKPISCMMVVK